MKATRDFDRRALAVVEAAYRIEDDVETWIDGVLQAVRSLLDGGHGVVGYTYRLRSDGQIALTCEPRTTLTLGATFVGEGIGVAVGTPAALVRPMFVADPPIVTLRSMWPTMPHEDFPAFRPLEHMASVGFHDYVAVRGCDPTGAGLMVGTLTTGQRTIGRAEVERWRLLRAHLLAGLRLRRALEDEAVLNPDGRVVHAEGEARGRRALEALRDRARQIDRARAAPGRRDPAAALQAWEGLVSGRWSLVDRFDSDGRRYLVARRNDPELAVPRSLSQRERQVLAYAALGYANKHIAYTLGLSPSTVSSHLRSAMRRVGAPSRAALADLWLPAAAELARSD